MSFDIKLTSTRTSGSRLANTGLVGEIQLGYERERFVSLIGFWSPQDYTAQWARGIGRIVDGHEASCLITSIHDPHIADIGHWWLLYRIGDDMVAMQEGLLNFPEIRESFRTSDPYESIPPRIRVSDDGFPISEWQLPLQDFVDFLDRTGTR